jgi:ABC-2 type transport system ATP-binding protein
VTAIRIDGLRVVRGGNVVIPDLDLDVGAGVVTGLLGPSGSGKTTLMRAIVGVQIVARGSVRVLGMEAGSPELRPRIGYVTQAPSVYADLSVRENLRYFGRVVGAPATRVDEVLAVVALADVAARPVRRLSAGQRSRVALATALLGRPQVLVLDEPTVGLDPVLRRDLWDMFHTLAADGAAMLVSSHVIDEAERCDTLVLLRDGRVLAAEPPESLLARTGAGGMDEAFLALAKERERRGDACNGGTCAAPAAPRSPDTRARAARPAAPAEALQVGVRGGGRGLRPDRRPARRPLSVHVDVRRDLDRDAARADERHARAADDDAAREA